MGQGEGLPADCDQSNLSRENYIQGSAGMGTGSTYSVFSQRADTTRLTNAMYLLKHYK